MTIVRDHILQYLRQSAEQLRNDYGVRRIGLFGSAARQTTAEVGDLDILVEMDEPTFDRYMDLKFQLEDHFGLPVDLVLTDSLKPRLRPIVEQETIYA